MVNQEAPSWLIIGSVTGLSNQPGWYCHWPMEGVMISHITLRIFVILIWWQNLFICRKLWPLILLSNSHFKSKTFGGSIQNYYIFCCILSQQRCLITYSITNQHLKQRQTNYFIFDICAVFYYLSRFVVETVHVHVELPVIFCVAHRIYVPVSVPTLPLHGATWNSYCQEYTVHLGTDTLFWYQ